MSSARFQKAINSVFHHMGVNAQYVTLGSDPQSVRVILQQIDPLVELNDRPLVANHHQIDVRVSELAEPKRGDQFVINDQHYRIDDEPQLDQHRLIWRMTVSLIVNQAPPVSADHGQVNASQPIATQTARLRMR